MIGLIIGLTLAAVAAAGAATGAGVYYYRRRQMMDGFEGLASDPPTYEESW
jgi:hypothetical protein